jgi:hypothetical protein
LKAASARLGHPDLGEIVTVKYSAAGPQKASLTNEAGELETVDATQLDQLPRLLRNGIAHFNVLPLAEGHRFGGIPFGMSGKARSHLLRIWLSMTFARSLCTC